MAQTAPNWKVTLSDIDFGPEEERAVLDVLRGKWLSMGSRTQDFEREFAREVGARHAVALGNGTAALHLALLACGVEPGDEVIVPALTFVATANAAIYCGARPVFADVVGESDLLIDPRDVERKITPRTRAIVPVHYAGYPCDMDALQALAADHSLRIVEDACHAPGAVWGAKPIGSIGDASCFSFFANKNLVTGEGGMVTTDDESVADAVRVRRNHGMTAATLDKHRGQTFSYDVVCTGYNYRLTEIEAALGLAQLARLRRNNEIRRGLVRRYREGLAAVDRLVVPFEGREESSSCHIMPVVLPEGTDRPRVQSELKERGVQSSVHYPPLHRFSRFRDAFEATVPNVDRVATRLLTLPLHPLMANADVELVCEALRESLRAAGGGVEVGGGA